jgi:hypothetical protein
VVGVCCGNYLAADIIRNVIFHYFWGLFGVRAAGVNDKTGTPRSSVADLTLSAKLACRKQVSDRGVVAGNDDHILENVFIFVRVHIDVGVEPLLTKKTVPLLQAQSTIDEVA